MRFVFYCNKAGGDYEEVLRPFGRADLGLWHIRRHGGHRRDTPGHLRLPLGRHRATGRAPTTRRCPRGCRRRSPPGIDAQGFDVDSIISQLPKDYRVKAELSGPAYPTPIALETLPGKPFDIPSLALNGKHTLSNIRLVDGQGKNTLRRRAAGGGHRVDQRSADHRGQDPAADSEELQQRGVTFDSSNFTAYEFTAAIATESGQVPIPCRWHPGSGDGAQPRGHPAPAGDRHSPRRPSRSSRRQGCRMPLPPNLAVAALHDAAQGAGAGRRHHQAAADPRGGGHPRQHRFSAPVFQRHGDRHQRRAGAVQGWPSATSKRTSSCPPARI